MWHPSPLIGLGINQSHVWCQAITWSRASYFSFYVWLISIVYVKYLCRDWTNKHKSVFSWWNKKIYLTVLQCGTKIDHQSYGSKLSRTNETAEIAHFDKEDHVETAQSNSYQLNMPFRKYCESKTISVLFVNNNILEKLASCACAYLIWKWVFVESGLILARGIVEKWELVAGFQFSSAALDQHWSCPFGHSVTCVANDLDNL